MKVLFLANIPSPYRVDFFNELGKFCDLTVLYERRYATDREWKTGSAQNYTAIFLRGKSVGADTAFCPGVGRYLKAGYDIIVVGGFSTPTGMLAIEYMRLRKIRFCLSCDGGFIRQEGKLHTALKRHFIGGADQWLSTGGPTNEYLCRYGAALDRVHRYPFTSIYESDIRLQPTKQQKLQLRQQLDIPYEKVVLAVGQFIHRKGNDVLIRAAALMEKNIGVYIVGGTPTQEYLDLKESCHAENVHFVDFQDRNSLSQYYMVADVFVMPTREDIWGLVVNEAMAHGLPVVTTDCCVAGVALVNDGENGFLVPAEEPPQLAEKLSQTLADEKRCAAMGAKSLDMIRGYTIENMARVHMQIFEKITE